MTPAAAAAPAAAGVESRYAWLRLAAVVALGTVGGVGFWSIVVVLPAVQAEFGVGRAEASLPYTLAMLGFMVGGVLTGRMSDRIGIRPTVVIAAFALAVGYVGAAAAPNLWLFAAAYGLPIGLLGSSAVFAPLVADTSHWFSRRRGIAMAFAASGNYLAGTVWPPILQVAIDHAGWRVAHLGVAVFCVCTMLPLALLALRRPSPVARGAAAPGLPAADDAPARPLGLAPNTLQGVLMLAGVSCCVAMSMPQVHLVAYCVDLGYGAQRGAEMLSLMLACGVASRLASGLIMDRIGGLGTLLLFSTLQAVALALYLPFTGLGALYVVSAVFGLFQGGLVPSYAMIVRENFPAREAGTRVGLALSSTLAGMALGGWLSGAIYDATGSYRAALANGIGWNLLTMAIALWLLGRAQRRRRRGGRPLRDAPAAA